MRAPLLAGSISALLSATFISGAQDLPQTGGRLPGDSTGVELWWALSSAAKIRPDTPVPSRQTLAVQMRCARNEHESVQLIIRPAKPIQHLTLQAEAFSGPNQSTLPAKAIEILQAIYLTVATPTDKSTRAGLWPDPLVPVSGPVDLDAGTNQAFWIRIFVPKTAPGGLYRGSLRLQADGWQAAVPLEVNVYDFALPDRMSCQTAFGFSPEEVFRYQKLLDPAAKRAVLEKYWADLSAHHISPYNPAPLDGFKVTWPNVRPPKSQWDDWQNVRIVHNEFHSGAGALLLNDDQPAQNVVVSFKPLLVIPPQGLHLRFWYRTAIPGHRFTVALNHYDADQQWLSGRNKDLVLAGNGQWQPAEYRLTSFPAGAKFVRLNLMATEWTDAGEKLGLVWLDDLSLQDLATGKELIPGGDFEEIKRTQPCVAAEQLRPTFDFDAWDKALDRAFAVYHFNSFSVPIPGLGGGTFFELTQPSLQGFAEDTPEYPLLLGAYCQQIQAHLQARGWLDKAYIYWFDEPNESQYPYLQNGFNKLKRFCPEIPRMITKHVEDGLIGAPNIWCAISDQYNQERAEQRRKFGERFWWYVCTGPKAPYTGLFLDHSAPEMRLWLWQTFQRNINGILVWQCNYWTSGTAYPDKQQPQNPYQDPMSWTSGYGVPSGKRSPWGNGDGRFIYPPLEAADANPAHPVLQGPVDSIRWEQLRDGIEDYEYLTLLRHQLDQHRDRLAPGVARNYEQLLQVPENITKSMTEFAPDGVTIELRRDQIAHALEKLTAL